MAKNNAFARCYWYGRMRGRRELPSRKTLAQIVKIIKDSDSLCNRPDDYYINRIEDKWKDESNR